MSKITKQSKRSRNSYWSSDSDSKEVISCSDCSTDYSSSLDIKSSHCGKDCNRKECSSSNSSESESNSIKSTEDQNFINETIEKLNNDEEIFINKENTRKPKQSPTIPSTSKKVFAIFNIILNFYLLLLLYIL